MYQVISNFFKKGSERSLLAKKHAFASFFIVGLDGLIGLLMVPLLLNYLDQMHYGIWLTMMSIISWFGFMDIGLGNGLRNKFAVAKANKKHDVAKKYVSTAYAILTIALTVFFTCFFLVNKFISWAKILNTNIQLNNELSILAVIIFGFFSLRFVLQLVTTIFIADQRPAIGKAVNLSGKLLVLIAIFCLTKTSTESILYVGLFYTGIPVFVLIIASFYFFSTDYRRYAPSIKSIDFKYGKDLIDLGWKFFIIQTSVAVLFATDNIIISQIYSPTEVTPYQVSHKYYTILLIGFSVTVSPLWSAYTEAFEKNEFAWIKRVISKQKKVWYFIIVCAIGMTLISKFVYNFWVGKEIQITYFLSASWGLFVILQTYNIIYTFFLNGTGKVELQMYSALISIIVNIPLSILLAKDIGLGLPGVILATCISIFIYSVTRKIQVTKIINGSATGIWNR